MSVFTNEHSTRQMVHYSLTSMVLSLENINFQSSIYEYNMLKNLKRTPASEKIGFGYIIIINLLLLKCNFNIFSTNYYKVRTFWYTLQKKVQVLTFISEDTFEI